MRLTEMTETTYHKEFTLQAFFQLGGTKVALGLKLSDSEKIFKAELGNLSLKKMILDLIHLVRPGFKLDLPFPWDKILQIELKDVVLSYSTKEKSIGFETDIGFDVGLLKLKRVYIDAKSVHDVGIAFDGSVFGEEIKKKGWNLVGADGPPTPKPKEQLFELNFLGVGQRLALVKAAQYNHVSDAIRDMQSLFEPPPPGTTVPSFKDKLVFDRNSNWLFGIDAEIMKTVVLAIVFNDPNLYGLYISLKGEKAKVLDGLEFEILYKKITEDIGVFQIQLKLPFYIRNMEFGSVSVTLPQIGIEIYSNGNFTIDFGFPHNLVFANSFMVQVFPFVGSGGFYFGVLNGATSTNVPQTTNGSFSPVLIFGIGLQLGVGKTIDKGILKAGITLTYVGILEGTLGWFKPYPDKRVDPDLPDFFYELRGIFAIVGKIWGTVSFSIITATLNLTVYASATVVIEACEPILLSFAAGVAVSLRVSINCGFFKIHIRLSFRTTISYQFTIGSSSPAQWKTYVLRAASPAALPGATPALEALTDQEKNVFIPLDWDAGFTDGPAKMTDLYYFTQFSATTEFKTGRKSVGVAMLFAPNSDGLDREKIQNTTITAKTFRQLTPFDQIGVAAFCWALNAARDKTDQLDTLNNLLAVDVTAVKLANIIYTLNNLNNTVDPKKESEFFTYPQLADLIKGLFVLNIKDRGGDWEPDKDHPDELHLSLFPVIPNLFLRAEDNPEIPFMSYHAVGDDYLKKVAEFIGRFSMMQNDAKAQQFAVDKESKPPEESMATLLFRDYFLLLIKAMIQSAQDALSVFKYTIPPTVCMDKELPTLANITDLFAGDIATIAASNKNNETLLKVDGTLSISDVRYSIESGDCIAGILENYGLIAKDAPVSDSLASNFVKLNGDKTIFAVGKTIVTDDKGNTYVLKKGDTINSVAKALGLTDPQKTALVKENKDKTDILRVFAEIDIPTITYRIKTKDTLLSISNLHQVRLEDLATENRDQEGILNIGEKIIIENVRKLNIGELLTYLYHDGAFGHAAGTASRFFLHGLRLPDVQDYDINEALYNLTGQQFVLPSIPGKDPKTGKIKFDYSITLSKTPQTDEDTTTDPLPWVAFNGQTVDPQSKKPAKLTHRFLQYELELAHNFEHTRYAPTLLDNSPVSIKLYNDQLRTFSFSNPIAWQQESGNGETSVTPSIWYFPQSLKSVVNKRPAIRMMVGTQPQKNAAIQKETIDRGKYTWSTLLPVSIRKVLEDDHQNEIAKNTYEVYGTDANGIDLLTDLVKLVNLTNTIESTDILFSSNPDNDEARALQSRDKNSLLTLFINTNLSTETNPDTHVVQAAEDPPTIASTTPEDMVKRLWKASLVRTGGYYLYYRDTEGNGLPAGLFETDQTAEIYLLIKYKIDKIDTFMNSVTIAQHIDTEQSALFGEWFGQDGMIDRIPAIQPGSVGFKIIRENPNKKYGVTDKHPDPTDLYAYELEMQYNLLDFRVFGNADFKDLGEGLPVGPEKDYLPENTSVPTTDEAELPDLTEPWKYKQAIPVAKIIKKLPVTPDGAPLPAAESPYIGLNKTVKTGFGWRDNYGNKFDAAINDLDFQILYFDYLLALTQWPHLNVHYEFLFPEQDDQNFQIDFLFNPERDYTIDTDGKKEEVEKKVDKLKEKAQADLNIYTKVYYQLVEDDVGLFFTVSMTPEVASYPQNKRVGDLKKGIIGFAEKVIVSIKAFIGYLDNYQEISTKPEPPPLKQSYAWRESIGNTNPDDIFALDVVFTIKRKPSLVNPAFKDVAKVNSVVTYIRPESDPEVLDSEHDKPPDKTVVTYNQLAETFEKLYPGMKVTIAYTRRGSQQEDKNGQEIWIVRFRKITDLKERGIGFDILYDQALFYAPQPLSNYLITLEQVPIYPYSFYSTTEAADQPQKKTFNLVDPETWGTAFLETIETTLLPDFSIPIMMFDNLLNKGPSKGFLDGILEAKQKVAQAIAFQTIPILQDRNMHTDGLAVAREKLKQQLLVNLMDGYNINAVVQYNTSVESNYPDEDNPTPPNLFGKPYVGSENENEKEQDGLDVNSNYALSTGKVALTGKSKDGRNPGDSYLTFTFNTPNERMTSVIPLRIDYKINHLEFDIRKLDDKVDDTDPGDIKNYSVSKWLSFVRPFISLEPEKKVVTHIPIPIRHYPRLANWGTQQFIPIVRSKELTINEAKQINYEFSYSLPQFTHQDTMNFEVLFNSKKEEEVHLLRKAQSTDDQARILQQNLAQFNEVREDFLKDLRILLPEVKPDIDQTVKDKLTKILASFEELANQVAQAWYNRYDPNQAHPTAEPSLKVITAKFSIEEGEGGVADPNHPEIEKDLFVVTLSNWSVTAEGQPVSYVSFPMVTVDGYDVEAYGCQDTDCKSPVPITDKNRDQGWVKIKFIYYRLNEQQQKVYLTFEEGVGQRKRTIEFKNLDVLLTQNAWAGFSVVRNAQLSETLPTSEEFVYTTPLKRFPSPVTPLLDVPNELDIASLFSEGPASKNLITYLKTLVKSLLKEEKSGTTQSASLKILTSYSYDSNPDIAPISQPCFLIPPTRFDETDVEGTGAGIQLLANGIIDWFKKNRPLQTQGTLYFDITFYSIRADNDLPVLRLRKLYLDLTKVEDLKQYAHIDDHGIN
jgi:hypothetical protein